MNTEEHVDNIVEEMNVEPKKDKKNKNGCILS